MKEKIKCIEDMLFNYQFKCIEICRDNKTGESNSYKKDDTSILSFENQKYIMFKNDIYTANKIIRYILGA